MRDLRTRSVSPLALAAACVGLAAGCTTPSAPNQVESPDDGEPNDDSKTSLLVPAPELPRVAPNVAFPRGDRQLG